MITPKSWGFEDEVVNLDYCGKRMFVREQHRCSVHKHEEKDEVLMVGEGLVLFEIGPDPGQMTEMYLRQNDRVRVKPGTWHRFTALRDTLIFEFSTHHRDEDSIRKVHGGRLSDEQYRAILAAYVKNENTDSILDEEAAKVIGSALKAEGRVVGFCNGCFDLLHPGHLELLRQARLRCEILFVGVNGDEAVRAQKGDGRPFVGIRGRAAALAATRFVDYVVPVEAPNFLGLVKVIEPSVYVTTSEYGVAGTEARQVRSQGGVVEVIKKLPGYSTTELARRAIAGTR